MEKSMAQSSGRSFGRRGAAGGAGRRSTAQPDRKFEVRYAFGVNWLGAVLVLTAVFGARDLLSPSPFKVLPLTNFDPALMWFGTVVTGSIGLAWLRQGLTCAPALVFSNSELSGYTLLGTKTIRWADIDRLQVKQDNTYGTELIIHAKRGSRSGSIWLNCIPIAVNSVDRSLEEMITAIQSYRPDIPVEQGGLAGFINRLFGRD